MLSSFSDFDIEQQVLAYMDKLGVSPAPYEKLILDGQLHRYDILGEKRGKLQGAYCIHTDCFPPYYKPAGFIQDWKHNIKVTWSFDTSGFPKEQLDYFNSDEYKAIAEKNKIQRQKELEQLQRQAIDNARIRASTLPDAP